MYFNKIYIYNMYNFYSSYPVFSSLIGGASTALEQEEENPCRSRNIMDHIQLNPQCDGKEDIINFDVIPDGKGACSGQKCYSIDTLKRVFHIGNKMDPYTRRLYEATELEPFMSRDEKMLYEIKNSNLYRRYPSDFSKELDLYLQSKLTYSTDPSNQEPTPWVREWLRWEQLEPLGAEAASLGPFSGRRVGPGELSDPDAFKRIHVRLIFDDESRIKLSIVKGHQKDTKDNQGLID